MSKKKNQKTEIKKSAKIIPIIIAATQLITSSALVIALKRLNLLQTWQLLLVALTLLALEALTIYKLIFSKKAHKATKITIIILSILISLAAATGYKYVRQTVNFIETITGAHYETQTYKVLVLKSSQYNDIKQLNTQHIGFLLYISGSDSRIGINDTARSDVNILAVVNPKNAKDPPCIYSARLLRPTPRHYRH